MDLINIKDIFPTFTRIQIPSEVLFVDALNEVAMHDYNCRIDASAVKINKPVLQTHIFAHIVERGDKTAIFSVNASDSFESIINLTFLDTYLDLDIRKDTPEWRFTKSDSTRNFAISQGCYSQGYLQLLAHVALYNYFHPDEPRVSINIVENSADDSGVNDKTILPYEYCHLILLRDRGNKLFSADAQNYLGSVTYVDNRGTSQDWAAYCMNFIMHGMMKEKYTARQKYNHFKTKFAVGDVILVYSRISQVKKNNSECYKYINTCYPAVVVELTPQYVSYVRYTNLKTRITAYKDYQLIKAKGGGDLYTGDEIYAFPKAPSRKAWDSVGVEGYSYKENDVIVAPMEDDEFEMWIDDGKDGYHAGGVGVDGKVNPPLNTLDVIYAVFEDRGVSYDKQRFLDKYFNNKVPVYDIVRQGLKK